MSKLLLTLLLLLCFGCAQNHFNVPTESFADKVKMLGVVPIIVDADSDIRHPQREQLISLVAEMNRKYEQQLVRKLKATGNFYSVVLLDGEPQRTFSSLLFRREKRDDATIQYNKYFWKNDELRDYLRKNKLDAVMVIVVNGLSKIDKISSSTLLTSLTSEYNYLIMTAQILDANGTILWEYPNFRRRILAYAPMINLQYPDFSEAEANLSSKADVKFKTIEGIKRTFEQKYTDLFMRETLESKVYNMQFDEMTSLLSYEPEKGKKDLAPAGGKLKTHNEQAKPLTEQPISIPAEAKPAVASVPAVESSNAPTGILGEAVPAKTGMP